MMQAPSLDLFTHVRVIVGVVLALGITRILAGLTAFMQHPGHKPLYAAHLVWVAVVLLSAVHFWWFEFGLIYVHPWTFELFIFVLGYAFLFYLMATLLFPDGIEEYSGYEEYFISRRAWFYGLVAASVPIDLVDTFVKGPSYFHSLGPEYPVRLAIVFLLSLVGIWTKNRRFHLAFPTIYLLYLIVWIGRLYRVLD